MSVVSIYAEINKNSGNGRVFFFFLCNRSISKTDINDL